MRTDNFLVNVKRTGFLFFLMCGFILLSNNAGQAQYRDDRGYGYDTYQIARQTGYNDGMRKGRQDAREGHSNPEGTSEYRRATNGYNSRAGNKNEYKQVYRQAFLQGFAEGQNGVGYSNGNRGYGNDGNDRYGNNNDNYNNDNYNNDNYNNNGNYGNNGRGSVPNWAVGTFFGRNPQTGGTITLTISGNGGVSADFQGSQAYGTLNGNTLNMSGAIARVTRINNGLRTRGTDGQVIDYFRGNGY